MPVGLEFLGVQKLVWTFPECFSLPCLSVLRQSGYLVVSHHFLYTPAVRHLRHTGCLPFTCGSIHPFVVKPFVVLGLAWFLLTPS